MNPTVTKEDRDSKRLWQNLPVANNHLCSVHLSNEAQMSLGVQNFPHDPALQESRDQPSGERKETPVLRAQAADRFLENGTCCGFKNHNTKRVSRKIFSF